MPGGYEAKHIIPLSVLHVTRVPSGMRPGRRSPFGLGGSMELGRCIGGGRFSRLVPWIQGHHHAVMYFGHMTDP